MPELNEMDATAQAELVHSGQAAPVELVQAAIAEIERWNPVLNAVVHERYESALKDAAATDLEQPFAGVPLLVKDRHDCAGLPTWAATRYLAGTEPATTDDPVVARLRSAGFIPLGKSNMPELGLMPTTEPHLYGPCSNPWSPDRSSGGSSGGTAAAVAAGLVPAGTASDGGGSIRIPAAACGAFGLKPSRGRTPGAGWGGLSVHGVITRSVRDTASILDMLAARGPDNPACLPPPTTGSFLAAAQSAPRRLNIGLCAGFTADTRYHPEVWASVLDTAELLTSLGHTVEEVSIDVMKGPFHEVCDYIEGLVAAGMAHQLDLWEPLAGRPATETDLEPATWFYVKHGRELSASTLLAGHDALAIAAQEVLPLFGRFDMLMLPTLGEPAPPNGVWQFSADDPTGGWERMHQFMPRFSTQMANYLGHPAMSVPLHASSDGLPIGSQFYGQYADEAALLALAAELERVRPWTARHPELPG
jgi:amidase